MRRLGLLRSMLYHASLIKGGILNSFKLPCSKQPLVHFPVPGIMAILFCGIVMSHYTHYNLSPQTQLTVQQIFRAIAFITGKEIHTVHFNPWISQPRSCCLEWPSIEDKVETPQPLFCSVHILVRPVVANRLI